MKYLLLKICASLMVVCSFQVQGLPIPGGVGNVVFQAIKGAFDAAVGNRKDGYMKLPKCECSSSRDADQPIEQEVQSSKNEMSPPRRYFQLNSVYLDENNPGIQPNDDETLNRFALALSGVTQESLIKALGFDRTPIRNAYYKSLIGLILGQARGTISDQAAIVFLEAFMTTCNFREPILALKTITTVIADIKIKQDQAAHQLFPSAIEKYYEGFRLDTKLWAKLADLVDQLTKGKSDRDAAKKIIDVLASKYEFDFNCMKRTDPQRQEENLQTIIQHVIRYGKFLNRIQHDKRERNTG